MITDLCNRTQGHPFYTQHLCHVVWSTIEPGESVIEATIDKAVIEMLRRESHAYVTLWESLTKNEQRFLHGLAESKTLPKPYSSDFTGTYGFRSASNAQRAVQSLIASDVIERESSSYVITDRFFRLWINSLHV